MYAAQGQQKQAPVQIEKWLHILGKNKGKLARWTGEIPS